MTGIEPLRIQKRQFYHSTGFDSKQETQDMDDSKNFKVNGWNDNIASLGPHKITLSTFVHFIFALC